MQKNQNYKNHTRYFVPHHFVFYPLLLLCTIAAAICITRFPSDALLYIFITAIFLFIFCLSLFTRNHYALNNQDRIIRLEMRLRYFILTQQRFEAYEDKLSFSQITALRFASDNELPALLQRTVSEHLSSAQIKKSITSWQQDDMRV